MKLSRLMLLGFLNDGPKEGLELPELLEIYNAKARKNQAVLTPLSKSALYKIVNEFERDNWIQCRYLSRTPRTKVAKIAPFGKEILREAAEILDFGQKPSNGTKR